MIEEWNRNMNSIPDSFFGKNLPISPSEKKNQHIFERPFATKYLKKKNLVFSIYRKFTRNNSKTK